MGQTTRLFKCPKCKNGKIAINFENGQYSFKLTVYNCDVCNNSVNVGDISLIEIKISPT